MSIVPSSSLPSDVIERVSALVDIQAPDKDAEANREEFVTFVQSRLPRLDEEHLKDKLIDNFIDNNYKSKSWRHKYKRRRQKNASNSAAVAVGNSKKGKGILSNKKRRELGLNKINKTNKTFEMFLPINNIWKSYARRVLPLKHHRKNGWKGEERDNVTTNMQNVIRKIEYIGCFMRVTKSRCSEYIGTVGIVIKETKNSFTFICPDDRVKIIPKMHSEFSFVVENVGFSIFGSHLNQKPSVRAKNVFKKHCLWL